MKTIHQAFESGMEEFAKHCLRYGKIDKDDCARTLEGGFWRRYVISIEGWKAHITKENGRVTGAAML